MEDDRDGTKVAIVTEAQENPNHRPAGRYVAVPGQAKSPPWGTPGSTLSRALQCPSRSAPAAPL